MATSRRSARPALLIAAILLGGCNGPTPPSAPDAVPLDPGIPPPGSGVVGQFTGVGHHGAGTVRFTAGNGAGLLEFSSDFVVSAVPGPFVYLNTTNDANTGNPLRVSALRSNSGAQTYSFKLPAGVSYRYVLIWCDPFNVPVAEAAIPPTP